MNYRTLAAAFLALCAAHAAHAGDADLMQPGLHFAWTFGAQAGSRPSLSLGLYPNELGWRRMWADAGAEEMARVDAPAVLDWRLGDTRGLHLMGMPLTAETLGLNADEGRSHGNWGLRAGMIVLAAGAAAALVIGAAGDAAEENNPAAPGGDPGSNPGACYDLDPVPSDGCVNG